VNQGNRTGIVSFLFTDLEESSRLWEQEPQRMPAALKCHDTLARAAVEANHGTVVKMLGDGLHAAFDDPLDALLAAVALQEALADPAATHGVALQVRCGMHVGAVEKRDNDYFGVAVNRAQRIMDAGHGGQLLLSRAMAALVEDRLPPGVALSNLGAVRLRHLASPERVFQVVHPRLRQDFPPLRSLEATPNNLPQQVTSFIGRAREQEEIGRLLPQTRLLTLVGTGGIGKTRLLLQLAASHVDRYRDGVWYVDLAAISDPALVANALARVWGLTEVAGTPLMDTICQHARSQQTLLLLDNCEHLLIACARLANALLRAGPHIRILTTSREPLRTAGEQIYTLPALLLPDPKADLATFLRADAARLFVERARIRQPGFTVSEQQLPAVATICRRLDGIPLALELAAARVGTLPVETIAARLDDRFGMLTRGERTAIPRQQTLKALIDWSYDLLDGPEKSLFARLSVFASGWTLDAAEAVCPGGALAQADVLDLLDRLVQKSLVLVDEPEDRYGALETIRDYARDRLTDAGETETLRARHQQYYLALAEASEPSWRGRIDELRWLRSLEAEHANLRAALHWSLEQPGLAVNAVRFCGALGHFWRVRGHWREGRDWCSVALQKDAGMSPREVRAKALLSAAMMNARLGETPAAEELAEQALTLARDAGNRILEASALNSLSTVLSDHGNFERAHRALEEAAAINRELGNRAWESINLGNIGDLYIDQGDFAAARAPLEQALALSREIGSESLEAMALSSMGRLAERRGHHAEARALVTHALSIYRKLGAPAEEVEQMQVLAGVCVACGETAAAAHYLYEALRTSRELGFRGSIVKCFDGMVSLAIELAACERAALFQGAGQKLRDLTGVLATPSESERSDRRRSRCRAALGDAAYAAAESAGRSESPESVIGAGLAWLEAVAHNQAPDPAGPLPTSGGESSARPSGA
jgi:predicted ATPase/class 3 adenylate cyclase/Tfp pilus assembly protein PilF